MTPDATNILTTLAEHFGLPMALLIVILWSGYRQYWVWGWQLRAEREDKLFWREMHFRGMGVATKASQVAETVVQKVVSNGGG